MGITAGVVVLVLLGILGYAAVKVLPGDPRDALAEPTVVLSPTTGPPGTAVIVSGTGYGKSETIEIQFHATEVATTLAGEDGSFSTRITIPSTPFKRSTSITATGKSTIKSDSAQFEVT